MTRVVISSVADADTAEILPYLARKAGRATAARYNTLFERLYDRLIDQPETCPPRRALGPNVRIGIVPPYIVIYDHEQAASNERCNRSMPANVSPTRSRCSKPSSSISPMPRRCWLTAE